MSLLGVGPGKPHNSRHPEGARGEAGLGSGTEGCPQQSGALDFTQVGEELVVGKGVRVRGEG